MAGACRDSDSTRKAVAGRAVGAQRPRADRGVARTARSPVVAASLMALQRSAGNAAVRSLMAVPGRASGGPVAVVAQRLAEAGTTCPPAPVPPTPADPRADPKFTAVTGRVGNAAADLRKHPSGTAEAGKARDAAEPPANDKAGQAKAAQTDKMAEAKPKGFDKAGFIAAVNQAIAKAAPKNLDEADKFATSGKADGVKGEVMGKVTQGKEGSAKDVATATAQPPDPSVAKDKPVTPLAPASPASAPTVDGGQAMPGKAPAEQTDLRGGPCEVNSAMADAGVTDKHLTASNEPRMQQAAAAKGQAEAHAAQAPVQIRQKEDEALADAKASATTDAKAALAAMAGVKNAATGKAGAGKSAAKTAEETERARISGDINKIYDKTKSEVEAILTGLDAQVAKVFDTGEAAARREFTAKHKADMERYKDERYAGVTGAARWTADLFTGLPAEANQIFERAKAFYEQKMTMVISGVADIIGHELDTAKTKIATGRAEIRAYVANQPKNLQKLATQAANDINGKFDQLESDVDDKQNSLVEDLAQKYVEARTAVDEEIKAEQAKSQGLVDMVKNAVGESVRAILALKDMFMNLLSRAASAFTMILDAPVKFITNFMNAVKQGFVQFADNILTHLEKGLQSWLFGQLSASGIELPEKFDILGVLKMIASMLGLTWASIKARIIAADPFVGKVIDVVESKIEIFTKLATMGVAGVWEWIKEKVGDIKQMIFGQIKSFVIERVVKAGITWVLGMLNPAGALFKIVQALINVVQWIMERGAEMGEFIGTIIDAVMDIARGGGGGAPDKIEAALGKAVPLVLSFLASLLGLGGISTKVREFLDKGGELVMKGVDCVVKKALTLARPIIRALKAGAGWAMKKFQAGKAWVKGKYDAGKAWVKKKYEGAKGKVKGLLGHPKKKNHAAEGAVGVGAALAEATSMLKRSGATGVSIRAALPGLRRRHELRSAELVSDTVTGTYRIHVQREEGDTSAEPLSGDDSHEEAVALWEDTCGLVDADAMAGFQNWRSPGKGKAFGQERAVPVRLSDISLRRIRSAGDRWIDRANDATADQRDAAKKQFHARVDAAGMSREEATIYRRLREAASTIQALYGGRDAFPLDVEHLDEVAQNRDLYPRTSVARRYARASAAVRQGGTPGSMEQRIAQQARNAREAREIARLYAEQLVEAEIEQKTGGTMRSAGGYAEAVEIDLEILDAQTHARVTARRAVERRGT